MNIKLPEGTLPCPPYYEEGRFTTSVGNVSMDFIKTPSHSVWNRAFGDSEIDWETDWRVLWEQADISLGTGSDYLSTRVALEVQAYFANGEAGSVGGLVDCEEDDIDEIDKASWELFYKLCGTDDILAGCIGQVTYLADPLARPCLTLLVSGPSGGAEAAMIIRQALGKWGVNAGTTMRTIRGGAVGVVKIPFMPELYLKVGHTCYGINWKLWRALAGSETTYEWGRACLLWCESIVRGVIGVKGEASLMIDSVYFDCMRIIPLSQSEMVKDIIDMKVNIGEIFQNTPEHFLFSEDESYYS